jgi:2-polyprenyl-6-methoxyphenol hydroxylase-like FAD-dependent oxidoreductase
MNFFTAGMSGLSTAYWLRKYDPKLNVVVVEARGISSGATGRNGMVLSRWKKRNFNCLTQKFTRLTWPDLYPSQVVYASRVSMILIKIPSINLVMNLLKDS